MSNSLKAEAFLKPWAEMALEGAALAAVVARLGQPYESAPQTQLAKGSIFSRVSYENPISSLFFHEDHVVFVVLVEGWSNGVFETLEWWLVALGEAESVLQSRTGKNHRTYVYASEGVAATFDDRKKLEKIEYFPAGTIDDYMTRFYTPPPKFVK